MFRWIGLDKLGPVDQDRFVASPCVFHGLISIHAESPAAISRFDSVAVRAKELSQKGAGGGVLAAERVVEKSLVGGPNVGTEHFVLLWGDRMPLRPCGTGGKLFRCGGCKKRFDFCERRNGAKLCTHGRCCADLYFVQGFQTRVERR